MLLLSSFSKYRIEDQRRQTGGNDNFMIFFHICIWKRTTHYI